MSEEPKNLSVAMVLGIDLQPDQPAMAQTRYAGAAFRLASEHAGSSDYQAWYVLSLGMGLLFPTQFTHVDDRSLDGMLHGLSTEDWTRDVTRSLAHGAGLAWWTGWGNTVDLDLFGPPGPIPDRLISALHRELTDYPIMSRTTVAAPTLGLDAKAQREWFMAEAARRRGDQ